MQFVFLLSPVYPLHPVLFFLPYFFVIWPCACKKMQECSWNLDQDLFTWGQWSKFEWSFLLHPHPFFPSLPMSSCFWGMISAKSIGVLFEKGTIDPVWNDNPFSTVDCSGMGPGLHICFGGPARSQCPHIINSSSHSSLICSCILSDQPCRVPLHLSPSIHMKNDLAKWAVLHAPDWTPPFTSSQPLLLQWEFSLYLLDYKQSVTSVVV